METKQMIIENIDSQMRPMDLKLIIKDIDFVRRENVPIEPVHKDIFAKERVTHPKLLEKEMELVKLTSNFKKILNRSHYKKTMQAIKRSRSLWECCLKKAKGDIEKARQMYDKM